MWLVERITLALFGLVGGAYAVLALVIPQKLSKEFLGHPRVAGPPGWNGTRTCPLTLAVPQTGVRGLVK